MNTLITVNKPPEKKKHTYKAQQTFAPILGRQETTSLVLVPLTPERHRSQLLVGHERGSSIMFSLPLHNGNG